MRASQGGAASAPPCECSAQDRQQRVLMVRRLHPAVTMQSLLETFSAFGAITGCKVFTHKSGRSAGCASVEFAGHQAACAAFRELQGAQLNGKAVHLQWFDPAISATSPGGGRAPQSPSGCAGAAGGAFAPPPPPPGLRQSPFAVLTAVGQPAPALHPFHAAGLCGGGMMLAAQQQQQQQQQHLMQQHQHRHGAVLLGGCHLGQPPPPPPQHLQRQASAPLSVGLVPPHLGLPMPPSPHAVGGVLEGLTSPCTAHDGSSAALQQLAAVQQQQQQQLACSTAQLQHLSLVDQAFTASPRHPGTPQTSLQLARSVPAGLDSGFGLGSGGGHFAPHSGSAPDLEAVRVAQQRRLSCCDAALFAAVQGGMGAAAPEQPGTPAAPPAATVARRRRSEGGGDAAAETLGALRASGQDRPAAAEERLLVAGEFDEDDGGVQCREHSLALLPGAGLGVAAGAGASRLGDAAGSAVAAADASALAPLADAAPDSLPLGCWPLPMALQPRVQLSLHGPRASDSQVLLGSGLCAGGGALPPSACGMRLSSPSLPGGFCAPAGPADAAAAAGWHNHAAHPAPGCLQGPQLQPLRPKQKQQLQLELPDCDPLASPLSAGHPAALCEGGGGGGGGGFREQLIGTEVLPESPAAAALRSPVDVEAAMRAAAAAASSGAGAQHGGAGWADWSATMAALLSPAHVSSLAGRLGQGSSAWGAGLAPAGLAAAAQPQRRSYSTAGCSLDTGGGSGGGGHALSYRAFGVGDSALATGPGVRGCSMPGLLPPVCEQQPAAPGRPRHSSLCFDGRPDMFAAAAAAHQPCAALGTATGASDPAFAPAAAPSMQRASEPGAARALGHARQQHQQQHQQRRDLLADAAGGGPLCSSGSFTFSQPPALLLKQQPQPLAEQPRGSGLARGRGAGSLSDSLISEPFQMPSFFRAAGPAAAPSEGGLGGGLALRHSFSVPARFDPAVGGPASPQHHHHQHHHHHQQQEQQELPEGYRDVFKSLWGAPAGGCTSPA